MHIIKIEPFENGGHANQRKAGVYNPIPDGWAVIPEDMAIPDTYPFVNITVENGVVTSMTAGVVPDPDDGMTAAEKRERAYDTEAIISFGGKMLTVTEAAQQWQYYAAEGNAKAEELSALIAAAKVTIREKYPDEA